MVIEQGRTTELNMQKVKIFKSIESELGGLENEINSWMAESKVKVISVTGNIAAQAPRNSHVGSFSASDILIIIFYEES
jgi:hypothetical protein